MRVLRRNPKTGEIKLLLQNPDDLWHLANLVEPGDLVRASTTRREESRSDKIRPDRAEKVRMTLGIRVEAVEFQAFSDRLRITGTIEEGPQDHGKHHTLLLSVEDDLTIAKEWRPAELRRIDEAVAATQRPMVSFLSLDDEEALVAQMRQYGIRELATIRAPSHGKMFPTGESADAYHGEILAKLRQADLGEALLVLGPGFERERFTGFLREHWPDAPMAVHVHGTSQAGMAGIHEAMKAGLGAKVFEESRVAVETRVVEDLLQAISRNGPCAYGPAEVRAAVDAGAVETLLVTEDAIRSAAIEDLMRRSEDARGRILVVSVHHEAGKRLASLGRIAALLRFPIR